MTLVTRKGREATVVKLQYPSYLRPKFHTKRALIESDIATFFRTTFAQMTPPGFITPQLTQITLLKSNLTLINHSVSGIIE